MSTTIGALLDALAEELAGPSVPPARAEARDLIAGVLDQPRYWPSAHRDDLLDPVILAAIRQAATRRRQGMPIQYAIGRTTFRHLTLKVDRRALIPRPETEMLVDLVLGAQQGGSGVAVDVGTGTGAIALALAAEGGFSLVHATDTSAEALTLAEENRAALPVDRRDRVRFHLGPLVAPVATLLGPRSCDTVVSNPPYIARSEAAELPSLVRDWEPADALFADDEGMAVIRALVPVAAEVLIAGGLLAMEVDSRRADLAAQAVRTDGRFHDIETRLDLTGRPRFVVARRQEQ
jgi:release factor glutamine methyltransferase